MGKALALLAVIWLLLMPPLFTGRDCTRQFEEEQARIERDRAGLRGSAQASVPVTNLICKVYRDDEVRVRFFFDEHDRMERVSVDMKPFYSLPLPGGITIHWAK